jgi:hypothetical protein
LLGARNPDSTSRSQCGLADLYATEPGKPKSNFAATDSGCGTWFGTVCVNGELKVANMVPPVNLATPFWTVTKAA